MVKQSRKKSVSAYYDATVTGSRDHYDTKAFSDLTREYPANYFRLQLLLKSFKQKKIRRVFEVGVGEGTPLVALAKSGMDPMGFDIAPRMVEEAKKNLVKNGLDEKRVFWGDIQKRNSYAPKLRGVKPFDGLLALGVMPHVNDDVQVLKNMGSMVKKGGTVFIEFRNVLFSLFTQNKYTKEFILDGLLKDVDPKMKKIVESEIVQRLRVDIGRPADKAANADARRYDSIPSKFHNPFEVPELFKKAGFTSMRYLWYHYHPAMPYLENQNPALFRSEAIALEGESSGWRGYFLCSAFVIEATKK